MPRQTYLLQPQAGLRKEPLVSIATLPPAGWWWTCQKVVPAASAGGGQRGAEAVGNDFACTSMTYVSPACGTINNAMVFQNVEKDQCFAGGGDSGAPFYLKSGSNVYARGTVNAKDSEFCYGMKWSTISNALGVTIVTF